MNNFKALCMMTQSGIKSTMEKYLTEYGYEPINSEGYLYAKGTEPVLLVAHMDTVHREQCKDFVEKDGKLGSPQGIGGDDRCGIYIIMEIIKDLHCSVVLCEDEEKGCQGAYKFAYSKYINDLDVNYIVEFDRKNANDAVFYRCDNPEFEKFVTKTTGYKTAQGSCSDISAIAPKAKIAAVNLSCGYYNPHMLTEYVIFDEMLNTIEAAKKLISTESEKFEYIEKKYTITPRTFSSKSSHTPSYTNDKVYGFRDDYDQMSFGDYGVNKKKYGRKSRPDYDADFDICLEVVVYDEDGNEQIEVEYGKTKAEAWAKFFFNNPDISFSMIYDYDIS